MQNKELLNVKASRADIVNTLWQRGQLSWILYKHQRPIYNKIREVIDSEDVDQNSYVLDISRQFGKSFCMFTVAVEECLRTPYRTIVYIAPLKKQVVEIVTENTFRALFATAPKSCIPTLKDSELQFANGSRIRLSGTDNRNYEGLRGGIAHLVLLDEAGFMSDLSTGVIPTVLPMTKTTGGKILFASTPPETLDHDFYDILREHDEFGNISTFTIHDDKSLTQKQFDTIVSACKGQDTTLFKREYECQRIAEQSQQVIPELTIDIGNRLIVQPESFKDQLHPYWQKYVVADWGGKDRTAILFAHYNFRTSKVIIEDHLDLQGNLISSGRIAESVKAKVAELWPNEDKSIRYICDSNNVLIQNDMNVVYHLPFTSTSKDRLASQMVQKVRDWVYDERIYFAPNAEYVLKCAQSGWWAKGKDMFARSKIYGHYDALAALIYLVRNIDTTTDPVPRLHNVDPFSSFIMPQNNTMMAQQTRNLSNVFHNPRKGLSYK